LRQPIVRHLNLPIAGAAPARPRVMCVVPDGAMRGTTRVSRMRL